MTGKEFVGGILIEDVTSTEYALALDGLRAYLEVDVGGINTAADLSEYVPLVAPCLQIVIRAKSKLYEDESVRVDPDNPDSFQRIKVVEPVFKETLKDLEVIGKVGDGFIRLAVNQEREKGRVCLVDVNLPLERDIRSIALDKYSRDNLFVFAACDLYDQEKGRMYHPTFKPDDAEESRGYARLLQASIGYILSVLPAPVPVPAAFQF